MPDCYSANIAIGGKVTARQWQEIVKASQIFEMFNPWDPKHAGDYGEVYISETDGTLRAYHPEASWGQFYCEDYLVEQGIPFDRDTDPDMGNDGCVVSFRPGMERPLEVTADSEGEPTLTFDQLDRFLARMGEADSEAKFADLGEGYLMHRLRKDQPLPPFEFVPWRAGDFALGEKVVAESGQCCSVIAKDDEFVTLLRLDGEFAGTQVKVRLDDQDWELEE